MPRRTGDARRRAPRAYLLLHAAGTSELARLALREQVPESQVTYADESALEFHSAEEFRSADRLSFASNLFEIVGRTARNEVTRSIRRLAAQMTASEGNRDASPFRVMLHLDGKLTAMDREARATLEDAIADATGGRVVSRGSVGEYWAIGRRESRELVLGRRLPTRRPAAVAKGSLSPDLALMLVAASTPRSDDVVLDPFAGSGALAAARTGSPARRIIALEIDGDRRRDLRGRFAGSRVEVRGDDARSTRLPDGAVDAIVTDPPWGEFDDVGQDYDTFVAETATEMARVLNPAGGRLVILIARRTSSSWRGALEASGLHLEPDLSVLVNGHPASVIRGRVRLVNPQ